MIDNKDKTSNGDDAEDGGEKLPEYVKRFKEARQRKDKLLSLSDDDLDKEYQELRASGKIQCNDAPGRETKADRIVTIREFPDSDFVFRNITLDSKSLDTMAKDWDYSSLNNREVFRTLCLDEKTSDVHLSTERVEGKETSVAPDWTLCDKSFPGKKYKLVGSMHTHPDFLDKPLESMGDVIVFATSDKEMYSCTVTRWGATCMYRMKEPASVFDIPAIDPASDPEKPVPVRDNAGRIVYDVESDVVDWNRAMKFANRDVANSIFIVARGNLNNKLLDNITRVPWFKPSDIEQSIGTVEFPFKFGVDKSVPKTVKDMKCESFVDIVGVNAKVRTVCDDDVTGKNYYVESPVTPGRLFFFKNDGFPSNFYASKGVKVIPKHPLKRDESDFWEYEDSTRAGYHETRSEMASKLSGIRPERKTVRSASFKLDGEYQCEYLLHPLSIGSKENDIGKPGGLLCRERGATIAERCMLS